MAYERFEAKDRQIDYRNELFLYEVYYSYLSFISKRIHGIGNGGFYCLEAHC